MLRAGPVRVMEETVKKVLIVVGVLVVLFGGALLFLFTNLGEIIRRAVSTYGSEATQTSVSLKEADLSVTSGEGRLGGLKVANPKGFTAPSAFEVSNVSLKIDTASLSSDVVLVREVLIEGPQVTFELGPDLKSNLQQIQDAVSAYTKGDDDGGGKRGGGKGGGQGGGAGDGSGGGNGKSGGKSDDKLFIIDNLVIRGGRVTLASSIGGDRSKSVDLPEIRLTDIGKDGGGATGAQVAKIVLEKLTRSSINAAASGELESAAKGLLDKLGDGVKDIFRKKK